jgi:hypothetical protein
MCVGAMDSVVSQDNDQVVLHTLKMAEYWELLCEVGSSMSSTSLKRFELSAVTFAGLRDVCLYMALLLQCP